MTRALVAGAWLALLGALGCENPDRPEDPVWGKQACGSCAMLVSDPTSAAELVTADGTRVFFDDVGCMPTYVRERNVSPKHMWVRSASGQWVDAKSARYRTGHKTPMDFGFVPAPDGSASYDDMAAAAEHRRERKP